MRQFLSENEWSQIPAYVVEHIVQTSGFKLLDQSKIYRKFNIGLLLDLINKRIEPEFHIIKIEHSGKFWKVSSFAYTTEDKELLISLFKAFVWCYDDKKRKQEKAEEEKKWKSHDKRLVNERHIS